MAVNLSFIGGAGWQFFTDDGAPLSGGKLYTYAAGTTTPLTTYTSRNADTPNTNPIILDAAGRTPQQIWSTEGLLYKYVIKDANDVLIRSWDNIGGSVVADDLSASLANTTDNTKGDALVGFRQSNASGFLTGAVGKTVNAKLQDVISVKDFGAVGNGLADDTAELQAAINAAAAAGAQLYWPGGTYYITDTLNLPSRANWLGDGDGLSVIKSNGLFSDIVSSPFTYHVADVTIDKLGFDMNGYNAADYGSSLVLNSLSHTNIRIQNCRFFDSNYPGDGNIKQRQHIFVGHFNTNIWILNNNLSQGGRIKVGRGGTNVWIKNNRLDYVNDNAITMAMRGTIASPSGFVTENVHIEDNIIRNPTGNAIFLGADGEDFDDPAQYLKKVHVSRNIIILDTPETGQEGEGITTPRAMNITCPAGGVFDMSVNDNTIVMTTQTPNATSEMIRFGQTNNAAASLNRVSVCRNKIYTPYKLQTGIYFGCSYNMNDVLISENIIDGASEAIYFRSASTFSQPTIVGNIIRNCTNPFRTNFSPAVVGGSFSKNKVIGATSTCIFASTAAMEWRIEGNEILDNTAGVLNINNVGTKDFYIINNDFRGAGSAPIALTSGAVLSANSARYGNMGDTAIIAVASASTITLPFARVVSITGTTNIDSITATGFAGWVVTLRFASSLTVIDGTGTLRLAGNFSATANDTLTLACEGSVWEEVARSVN